MGKYMSRTPVEQLQYPICVLQKLHKLVARPDGVWLYVCRATTAFQFQLLQQIRQQ